LESPPSDEISVGIGDVVPPAVPQSLTATAIGSTIQLDWSQTPSDDADLLGLIYELICM
jgi:hypothetical protein